MAERLTEYFENGAYTEKQNIIDVSDKVKFFDNGCVMGKVIDKLATFEDIMEKYDIPQDKLENYIITEDKVKQIHKEVLSSQIKEIVNNALLEIKKDRDTWKKACELACETLKQVMGKPLWIGGTIPTPEVKDSEYFYQQAKNKD